MCSLFRSAPSTSSPARPLPRAPRRGKRAAQDARAAYLSELTGLMKDMGALIVCVATRPRIYPMGASCAVEFPDGTYQQAWFPGKMARLDRAHLVQGMSGPGPFEKRRTMFWVDDTSITGAPRKSLFGRQMPTSRADQQLPRLLSRVARALHERQQPIGIRPPQDILRLWIVRRAGGLILDHDQAIPLKLLDVREELESSAGDRLDQGSVLWTSLKRHPVTVAAHERLHLRQHLEVF